LKFSIIMPTYNRAHLIRDAVDSIVKQTVDDWELIIVDDASNDDTENIIKSYADSRIRYIRLDEHYGVAYARNVGYKLSQGEYIAIADSDDINHFERLEKMGVFLDENSNVDIAVSDIQIIDEHNNRGAIIQYRKSNHELRVWWLFQPKLPSFMMFRKERLLATNKLFHDESYLAAVDYQWYANLDLNFNIATVPEVLYYYRRHKNQISTDGYSVQQQYADLIRYDMLSSIGINPTAEEKLLHSRISQENFENLNTVEFNKCVRWLEKIYKKGIAINWIEEDILKAVLLEQLILIIESKGMFQEELFYELNKSILATQLPSLTQKFSKEKIQEIVPRYKRVYIYGTKMTGFLIGEQLIEMGFYITNYIDGNSNVWGKSLLNSYITSLEECVDTKESFFIISVLSNIKYEIANKLINFGVSSNNIVFSTDLS